ncbi:gliding motility lipoprotein GldH [Sediminitomix flava]|uniref:Gliding motility-associated lipoprotein GldH n=1 Tax=Sediminitomix flava TaxID=379075 RepID=A0A315ZA81_SEDFL|nr:gliding motility lipoprotein GldH [Sediminitomix flava]PWJ42496.1 gliding motility-associated lipoprotein GldH [Sediminitomix flava]
MKLFYFLSLALLPFLYACDSTIEKEEYTNFDNNIWEYDSISSFEFKVNEVNRSHNLLFNIRYSLEYPHYNLFVIYDLIKGQDTLSNNEMTEFNLMHPQKGAPFGESSEVLGNGIAIYTLQLPLQQNIKLDTGTYQLNLKHYMRPDSLNGVQAIGYRIEYAE